MGTSTLAAVLLIALVVLLLRRRSQRSPEADASGVGDLAFALERAREEATRAEEEARRAQEAEERAGTELRWLQKLSALGTTVDLDGVLQRSLEAATQLANAAAAMIVLIKESEDEPLVATFGLSTEESSRNLIGLPPEGGEARAVALAYRYTENEVDFDEFRLRAGLALPIADEEGARIGTLALFWRRIEREVSDEELARLEALAGALAPALRNAFLLEEVRRQASFDPLTGLRSAQSFEDVLAGECDRAHRYRRRLTLLLFRVEPPVTDSLLATVGERLRAAVRSSDVPCHAGDGTFAVLLPEAAHADAEHVLRRLQLTVDTWLVGDNGRPELAVGMAELRPEDDAGSLRERAHATLARARREPPADRPDAAVEPGRV